MRTTLDLHSRLNNSNIIFIRNVYCPTQMCSRTFCVHKSKFQYSRGSDYHCPQLEPRAKCGIFALNNEQTGSFCCVINWFTSSKRCKKHLRRRCFRCLLSCHVLCKTNVYLCPNMKKIVGRSYDCVQCKKCCHVLKRPLKSKKTQSTQRWWHTF